MLNESPVDNKVNTIHDLINDKHHVSFTKPATTRHRTQWIDGF